MVDRIFTYKDLRVYKNAMDVTMEIFNITQGFPRLELFSMVDQMRRCSRSVCTNIAEGWRKRRYKAAFIAKLNDAESEASEAQVWLEIARRCKYIDQSCYDRLFDQYEMILGQLVRMVQQADKWLIIPK
jgi:four helix bundle protein